VGVFAVPVGPSATLKNADHLVTAMKSRYGEARLIARDGEPILWCVLIGQAMTENGSRILANRIRQESSDGAVFVVRFDPR